MFQMSNLRSILLQSAHESPEIPPPDPEPSKEIKEQTQSIVESANRLESLVGALLRENALLRHEAKERRRKRKDPGDAVS